MEFTKYPESVTEPVGDEVTFECAVRVPGERLQWRRKPANDDNWKEWLETPGTSQKDSVSTKLVIEVKEDTPDALYQKRVITAPLHNTVVLHCKEPISEAPAILTWWKENKGLRKQLDTPHGVLVIANASPEDNGVYGCSATNELSGQTVDLQERTYLRTDDFVGVKEDGVLLAPVRPENNLTLWCGVVGTPPPQVTCSKEGMASLPQRREQMLVVSPFNSEHEGIYSCSANGIRRLWKAIAFQPPHLEGTASSVNASEESELHIDAVEKRHAGIVQCFACNSLGCAYDAALLTVVPVQISDQVAKTHRSVTSDGPSTSTESSEENVKESRGTLVTAGGVLGAAALLLSGEAGVEMSFLHNNNCGNNGNNDDTLPHPRKNRPPRQYV
ncbi:unnamed protein product [Leptidea sinapis]|uniref:Ig-like domain-containing protein n=1 Tax=Leptidea sinapis TaxID=189913 RepID=A0A5E4R5V5_9NEOP|nr:unnamed protein product [Leptidea sinapis]